MLTIEQCEASHMHPYREHDEHACDVAAYLTGCARTLLYGIEGQETADPAGSHRDLIKAQGHLRSALRMIEAEQARLCFDYGLEDPSDRKDQEVVSVIPDARAV